MQTTNQLLMIRPADFKFNQQTAANNRFQQDSDDTNIQKKAVQEFDAFVAKLSENDIDVLVIADTLQPETPDSIFPNNWISFHEDSTILLYPMFSENRRLERRDDILAEIKEKFVVDNILDLSKYEERNVFLEGTGSLVLDRQAMIAYACRSLRTNEEVVADFCRQTGYHAILFNANDSSGFPIYHTNVMMCVGSQFAVVCLETITDSVEKKTVIESLLFTGKEVIEISMEQMNHFAGNMLQVQNAAGEQLLVMSEQAYDSLSAAQVELLLKYNKILTSPIPTIEKHGGGSARCMLAEIHLKKK